MSLKISRILHAGYYFDSAGSQIAFDPIFENPFSRNCYAFPSVEFDCDSIRKLKLDAVFISHFHDDHCSLESLDLLNRQTPIYLYCLHEELFELIRQLGFVNVQALELNQSVTVGQFEVVPRRALDVDVDTLFQIRVGGLNILNVVDSWIDPPTLQLLAQNGPWDMVLWPFQTMREVEVLAPSRAAPASRGDKQLPEEWIEQLQVLNPRYIVPSSCQLVFEGWSWYNQAFFPISYQQFGKEVLAVLPKARIVRLNPSESVLLDPTTLESSVPLAWIRPIGDQEVDYTYDPTLVPPPTSEVARQFQLLSAIQTERVYQYCLWEMREKYRSLEPSEDPYFAQIRMWRLSVYDHLGAVSHFHYRLSRESLELADDREGEFDCDWLTEVPISKLYAALEEGESLTSMYLRVNDIDFPSAVETVIRDVDIVEDPLIRCLFNGNFGSYQKAQWQRIKSRQNTDKAAQLPP